MESHSRSIVKAVTWRAGGTVVTSLIAWMITGEATLSMGIGLAIHPSSTIFREFEPERRRQMGIDEDMIRVAVGIENFDDIREDFQQAIDRTAEI